MTDSLKARIKEDELSDFHSCDEVVSKYQYRKALLAVLEIEEKKTKTMTSTMEALKNTGYNQALADVRAQIEGAMEK
jgi:hypothetical protein